jgi:hypothetical protein
MARLAWKGKRTGCGASSAAVGRRTAQMPEEDGAPREGAAAEHGRSRQRAAVVGGVARGRVPGRIAAALCRRRRGGGPLPRPAGCPTVAPARRRVAPPRRNSRRRAAVVGGGWR